LDRNSKKAFVAAKNKTFQDSSLVVIFHYRGMTVAQITKLRGAARKLGVSINVTKNTLTKLALKGTIFEGIADLFKGPTAIATSKDPVAAAKIVADLAKDNEKVAILGGGLNSTKLDEKGVKALAELPSLDALRSKLLGVLVAPATKIAGVAQAPAGQLARVFNAYATK
jgi:large subunit ribosomal protein L10